MRREIRPLDDDIRAAVIERAGAPGVLPQHHPVWVDVLLAMGEDCRGLVGLEDGKVAGWILYTIRKAPLGIVVSSLPYLAYGGPGQPDGNTAVVPALLQALRAEAVRIDADVVSVGTSPWLGPEMKGVYRQALGATHEYENFVQLHEISRHPLERLSGKRRSAFRSELNRAARSGLRVKPALAPEEFAGWLEIYRQRYSEISANPYPPAFHRKAFELGVPAGVVEVWGVFDGPVLVGGNLFLVSSGSVDYFSSAFLSAYRSLFPNTFLLDEALRDFAGRGLRCFNWQSSPERGGVYQYKKRWGAYESRHYYLSALLKPGTRLLKAEIAEVRQAYPFRFVLPFSLWLDPMRARKTK